MSMPEAVTSLFRNVSRGQRNQHLPWAVTFLAGSSYERGLKGQLLLLPVLPTSQDAGQNVTGTGWHQR